MEWLETAKKLPYDSKSYVTCPQCEGVGKLCIAHRSAGYSAYCFRCGDDFKKFSPHGTLSLKQLLERTQRTNQYVQDKKIQLPHDFSLDIPREGMLWLLKAGISAYTARLYGLGYSEYLQRVVLPVRDSKGVLKAVQCRAVHKGQSPKYINKVAGTRPLFWAGDYTDKVVIVEDILSAIKVAPVMRSVSTLGTSLSLAAASEILLQHGSGYVWYDPDTAGLDGAYKALTILQQAGGVWGFRNQMKDPKFYNKEQIQEILT